jgi:ElaA protein
VLTWQWFTFSDLSLDHLYEILALRQRVFSVEQNCVYQDIDFVDQEAMHLLGIENNKLVAYLRLYMKNAELYFGRVVSAPEKRGQGLGKLLMQKVLAFTKEKYPKVPIYISAQQYLQQFYEAVGFIKISEPYLEDGIFHIRMCLESSTLSS